LVLHKLPVTAVDVKGGFSYLQFSSEPVILPISFSGFKQCFNQKLLYWDELRWLEFWKQRVWFWI